jgi:coenzyme F420-reducing hydrogenase gamma subunit
VEIRSQAKLLIALGTCATAGGIQALRNFVNASELATTVYAHPEYLQYLETSKPISQYVKPDMELWGCPVNKAQVLEVIAALLAGRKPNLPSHSVCLDCKLRGTSCVLVDSGVMCLGPVTQAGCGALCPALRRGCYGCFGPANQANSESLAGVFLGLQTYEGDAARMFRGISGYAPAFEKAASKLISEGKEVA